MNKLLLCGVSVVLTWNLAACSMSPQVDAQIVVNYAQKGAMVNPKMYGIFLKKSIILVMEAYMQNYSRIGILKRLYCLRGLHCRTVMLLLLTNPVIRQAVVMTGK